MLIVSRVSGSPRGQPTSARRLEGISNCKLELNVERASLQRPRDRQVIEACLSANPRDVLDVDVTPWGCRIDALQVSIRKSITYARD